MPDQQLWKYEDFSERLPGVTYRTVVRESQLGRFPAGTRFSKSSRMVWPAAKVREHLDRLWAPLEVPA